MKYQKKQDKHRNLGKHLKEAVFKNKSNIPCPPYIFKLVRFL